jgi:hypothetical protein
MKLDKLELRVAMTDPTLRQQWELQQRRKHQTSKNWLTRICATTLLIDHMDFPYFHKHFVCLVRGNEIIK